MKTTTDDGVPSSCSTTVVVVGEVVVPSSCERVHDTLRRGVGNDGDGRGEFVRQSPDSGDGWCRSRVYVVVPRAPLRTETEGGVEVTGPDSRSLDA